MQPIRAAFFLEAVQSEFQNFGSFFSHHFSTEVFQVSAQHETDFFSNESVLFFNFEVSPVAVRYSNARENILQFLINIGAILGGVFTVAGILDALIHKSSKIVFKQSINKFA